MSMIIDLPTVTLPQEALKENLHISYILVFDDDDERCTIFLEGWKNWEMIQRACIL